MPLESWEDRIPLRNKKKRRKQGSRITKHAYERAKERLPKRFHSWWELEEEYFKAKRATKKQLNKMRHPCSPKTGAVSLVGPNKVVFVTNPERTCIVTVFMLNNSLNDRAWRDPNG